MSQSMQSCSSTELSHILKMKFKLLNNKDKKMFSMKVFRKNAKRCSLPSFLTTCTVCNTDVPGLVNLKQHLEGKRHGKNIRNIEQSLIKAELLRVKFSLVGVEYLLELVQTGHEHIIYVCMLCDFNCKNVHDTLDHLDGIGHRKKFLMKHFPSTLSEIVDDKTANKVCRMIQNLCGTLDPMVCFYKDLDSDSAAIWDRIEKGKHVDEGNMPMFVAEFEKKIAEWNEESKKEKSSKRQKVCESNLVESREHPPKKVKLAQNNHSEDPISPPNGDQKPPLPEQPKPVTSTESFNDIKMSILIAQEVAPTQAATDVHPKQHRVSSLMKMYDSQEGEIEVKHQVQFVVAPDSFFDSPELTIEEINFLVTEYESLCPFDQNVLMTYLRNLAKDKPEKFSKLE